jgi:hypothetical protein
MMSAYSTLQEKDRIAYMAKLDLEKNPDDYMLRAAYNSAAREYIGATTNFPGNLIADVTGYPQDKWPVGNEPSIFASYPGILQGK